MCLTQRKRQVLKQISMGSVEKEMAAHSSILAWKIPWIAEPGRLPKECSNYRTFALISHASKVMLKILQARLQQYVNRELETSDDDLTCDI